MAERLVEEKPSATALFTALRRALAAMEYPGEKFGSDHLAVHFLPPHFRFFLRFKKIRTNTKEKLEVAFPGVNVYVIARTVFFDKLFVDALKNQTPQIVLLGAGYDSRAVRFAELNQSSTIFELDIAPTQERKKKCLKAARIHISPQVRFVPVDFDNEPLSAVLENAGYQENQKTLFIWEGVSYYLDAPSVEATLGFTSRVNSGSLIAFDYAVTVSEEDRDQVFGVKELEQSMQEHHTTEGFKFTLGEEEIEPFLTRLGLKQVELLSAEEIEQKYMLKEDGSSIGRIPGYFRFAIASPMEK